MKLLVTDRQSIEKGIVVRSSYALISIRDSDAKPVRLPNPTGPREVLHLAFDDSEPVAGVKFTREVQLMSADQAREIWRFVDKHKSQVGAFVVHCKAGMSRSPAVAAALAVYLKLDEQMILQKYQPNRFVYDLMRQTMPGNESA
jgi:predicted protein tyrosine phosphatase